jgi:gliding motility-associated-like protein
MPQLYVPTAFTPNGDHINDIFIIKSPLKLSYYHISIYESDNILVYQSDNINLGWDGTNKGQPEPSGSYLWIINCQTEGSKVYTSSGYVELIR